MDEERSLPLLRKERRSWDWAEKRAEARRLGEVAAPMVAVSLAQFFVQVSSNMMVGQLGELELSSAAIASSISNVTGFSLLLGLASALETLCGQAYGAEQFQKLGMDTYKSIVALSAICIPISLLWASMDKLLAFIGQDPAISQLAGRYAAWLIPGLFAFAIVAPLSKFLQCQSLTLPLMLTSLGALCVHLPLCWFLVFKTSLGYIGAAVSVSISYWFSAFVLGIYISHSDSCKSTRSLPSAEIFRGIDQFLRIALPSAIMICLEWWSYELLVLLSGLMPRPELEASVLSICLTSVTFLYTIPYGLGAAASTRVSNELGAGNPDGARSAVHVAVMLAAVVALVVSSSLLASRHLLGHAYSSVKEVIEYASQMVPLICLTVITDGLQGVLSGIARGCGWQHLGAYVNLGAFYLLGIPVAVVLGFPMHLGGRGLWIGIVCGSVTQTLLLFLITTFTNWQKMADKAKERCSVEKSQQSGPL